ncbi:MULTISPECIES: amidase family protein [Bacillaceae]|uniref:amidase family protein n=1 Tax=Bacillaceae TaxID=186817 RepID=UPI0009E4DB9C|nr:amidase family protein [Bacillus rubiinfantis]
MKKSIRQLIHILPFLGENAIEQAKEAEDAIMRGQYKGPLHGIPMGIKDNYSTAGIRSTAGTKIFADHFPMKEQKKTQHHSTVISPQKEHCLIFQ